MKRLVIILLFISSLVYSQRIDELDDTFRGKYWRGTWGDGFIEAYKIQNLGNGNAGFLAIADGDTILISVDGSLLKNLLVIDSLQLGDSLQWLYNSSKDTITQRSTVPIIIDADYNTIVKNQLSIQGVATIPIREIESPDKSEKWRTIVTDDGTFRIQYWDDTNVQWVDVETYTKP